MTMDELRRLSVTVGPDGRAQVEEDELRAPIALGLVPGLLIQPIWGTNEPPTIGARHESFAPYFPDQGGLRLVATSIPPDSAAARAGDPDVLVAEANQVLPGLLDGLSPDEFGRHRTDTVDVDLIVEGELWLELDDGTERRLTAGSCVILHGASHAWHNRGDRAALMISLLVGAKRA
jgi:hypothetical protein